MRRIKPLLNTIIARQPPITLPRLRIFNSTTAPRLNFTFTYLIRSITTLPSRLPSQEQVLEEDEDLLPEEEEFESEESIPTTLPSSQLTTGNSIVLRPYQLDCEEHVLAAFRPGPSGGLSRVGVSAPTGSGKTAIFTSLIRRLAPLIHPGSDSLATQVLIIVGSIELARQAATTARLTWPHLVVEIEQGAANNATGKADVTVATYQTLSRGDFSRLRDKFDPKKFKAVIVDEAHHSAAKSYLSILAYFNSRIDEPLSSHAYDELDVPSRPIQPRDDTPSLVKEELLPVEKARLAEFDEEGRLYVPIIGFTATFGRADGYSLGKIFERIVWHGEWLEMIRGRWLSELRFTTVKLESLDLSSVSISSKGDFSLASLADAVDTREVIKGALLAWMDKASKDCKSTLVFAVNIQHILSLTAGFRALGIDARFVHEKTPTQLRLETLRAFKNLEFPVLVNCGILTEGADFPAIDCVLLARPTKSHNLFLQMIGRGLRLYPGKSSCLILDLAGNTTNVGIMSAPTLFGIDPDEAIENLSTKDLKGLKEDEDEKALKAKEKEDLLGELASQQAGRSFTGGLTYTDYPTVFDLVDDTASTGTDDKGLLSASAGSHLAWVGAGGGIYILEMPYKGHMRIGPVQTPEGKPAFVAHLHRKTSFGGSFLPPVFLGRHSSLSILIRKIDADVRNHPDLQDGVDLKRNALWRRTEATPGQKTFLMSKLGLKGGEQGREEEGAKQIWLDGIWLGRKGEVDLNRLTKGEASDIISRVVHGGMGFLKKQEKRRKQSEKSSKSSDRRRF